MEVEINGTGDERDTPEVNSQGPLGTDGPHVIDRTEYAQRLAATLNLSSENLGYDIGRIL